MTIRLDVVVIGGGPAGLSAAMVLGRCRRRVVVCDSAEYRNGASPAMHGFLSRDGCDPAELRRIGRDQLRSYQSVEVRDTAVVGVTRDVEGFSVRLATGDVLHPQLVLLATGVVDAVPELPRANELYGRGVFHCPYCDGFEFADRPLVAYGRDTAAMALALELTGWSDQVLLCTDGPTEMTPVERARLAANKIATDERRISRLEGDDCLRAVVFNDGSTHECAALFFHTRQRQRSDLAARMGCTFSADGSVITDNHEASCIPGLYIAGDSSRDVQSAIVAAAEGFEAAAAMNTVLLHNTLK